jgi:hypothetical protein
MTRIISADCHINEPPQVFDRVPPALRDRAPRMLRGPDGGDGWSFDGKPPKRTFGVEAMAGRNIGGKVSGLRFDEILPGNYDGAAHARDMQQDGVDVSIVYPAHAIFVYLEPDRELGLACLRSYNDWLLEDFQGAAPDRIVGLPLLPVDDGIETCTAELLRVIAKGARGAFIPASPARPYHDPYYDPLYRAAEERGVPLTFHRNRVSLLQRGAPLHLHDLRRGLRALPAPEAGGGGGELQLAPLLGADGGPVLRQRLLPLDGRRADRAAAERAPGREPLRDGARRRPRLPHDA